MVFNKTAPSKDTFTGFLADEWKIARKINTVNYATFGSFNFGNFCARNKVLHM